MKSTAYLFQASLILLWWIGLSMSSEFFSAFQFPEISPIAFKSFLAPYICVIAALSIFRAYKASRDVELIILGGFAFGTLYCINASILTHGGILATTLMTLGMCYNIFLVFQEELFAESQSSRLLTNAIKTIIQIICVWFITLVLFPWIIIQSFDLVSSPTELNSILSISLFILFSLLGLTSALVMVKNGEGTPLPSSQTKKLVQKGPSKYVRNPMAIAGLGQGIAIAIYFSSIHLVAYTILGAIVWQYVVRPIEERDMKNRFGEEYELYRQRVKCWVPGLGGNNT